MGNSYRVNKIYHLIVSLVLVGVGVWLISVLESVLLPFAVACLLAYMLEPLVQFNMRVLRLSTRMFPVVLAILEVILVLVGLTYVCVPLVDDEIIQLKQLINDAGSHSRVVPFMPQRLHNWISEHVTLEQLGIWMSGGKLVEMLDRGSIVVGNALGVVVDALQWLLVFIYLFFVLLDYPQMRRGVIGMVPSNYKSAFSHIWNDVKRTMSKYFRAQALLAICAAIFYCVGFSIVDIPMAIFLGVLTGLLYMIPYFQYITIVPVALVCVISAMAGQSEFWSEFGKCLLVYAVSQGICDYVLTPKIQGKAMGLNPAMILLSLSVWGTLLGLIGMVIALPATALIVAYYKELFVEHRKLANVKSPSCDKLPQVADNDNKSD